MFVLFNLKASAVATRLQAGRPLSTKNVRVPRIKSPPTQSKMQFKAQYTGPSDPCRQLNKLPSSKTDGPAAAHADGLPDSWCTGRLGCWGSWRGMALDEGEKSWGGSRVWMNAASQRMRSKRILNCHWRVSASWLIAAAGQRSKNSTINQYDVELVERSLVYPCKLGHCNFVCWAIGTL